MLFGDAVWPAWKPQTGRDVRRSVLHDRLVAAGAHFGVSAGWEFAEWFAARRRASARRPWTSARQPRIDIVAEEHRAVREAVGVLDMSLMAKLIVQGPDAGAVLNRLSATDVTARSAGSSTPSGSNAAGGIMADLTVTRLEDDSSWSSPATSSTAGSSR